MATPYRKKPVAKDPNRKYFRADSLFRLSSQISGHDIAGDRRYLETDEYDHQVVGGRHQTLSRDGEEQKRMVFAGFGVLAIKEFVGGQNGQDSNPDAKPAEECRKPVHDDHSAECRTGVVVGDYRGRQSGK